MRRSFENFFPKNTFLMRRGLFVASSSRAIITEGPPNAAVLFLVTANQEMPADQNGLLTKMIEAMGLRRVDVRIVFNPDRLFPLEPATKVIIAFGPEFAAFQFKVSLICTHSLADLVSSKELKKETWASLKNAMQILQG